LIQYHIKIDINNPENIRSTLSHEEPRQNPAGFCALSRPTRPANVLLRDKVSLGEEVEWNLIYKNKKRPSDEGRCWN